MKELVGKIVTGVYVSDDQYYMKFDIKDAQPIVYHTDGDCCSETWFADIVIVEGGFTDKSTNKNPLEVVVCEELDIPSWMELVITNDGRGRQEVDTVYGFKLIFKDKDYIYKQRDMTVIFRNSSNGYYGGCVELVDQENTYFSNLLKEVEWVKINSDWRGE